MMGQPVKGDKDNLQNINADMLRTFHSGKYFGENIVVVGTGNIDHISFAE